MSELMGMLCIVLACRHLLELCGPLPQYHPAVLQYLLLSGRRSAAAAILGELAAWLPQYQTYCKRQRYAQLYRMTTGDGEAITSPTAAGALGEATTPKTAADEPQGPPAFPGIPLDSFLDPALKEIPQILEVGWARALAEEKAAGHASTAPVLSGTVAASTGGARSGAEPAAPSNASMESGILDMSVFGGFGMGTNGAAAAGTAPSTSTARHASPAPDPMATGMLDMAAFGMGTATQPTPAPDPMATGMLDMTAFGIGTATQPSPAPVQQGPPPPPIDTGLLDMSAFGPAFGMPTQPVEPSAPPSRQGGSAGVESGVVDLAAFGMGAPQQTPVPKITQAPHQPAASNAQRQASQAIEVAQQAQQAAATLRPFSTAAVEALLSALGAAPRRHGRGDGDVEEEFNSEDDALFRAADSNGRPGADASGLLGGMLRLLPSETLPGLTLNETRDVLAIALLFSEKAGFQSSLPVDEAAAEFLSAVTLACTQPHDDQNEAQGRDTSQSGSEPGSRMGSSASLSSLWGSRSASELSSASKSSLLKPSRSMRNAAGVEYTLPPSMASSASLASAAERALGELQISQPEPLARSWGLAPGLEAPAVMWALLSGAPEALLEHSVERLQARAAALAEEAQASAVGVDASAAFAPLPAKAAQGALTWDVLRAAGAGFWLQDQTLLRKTAEAVAKAQFAAKRNADDAALLYMALGKQSVLHGLYRSTQQAKQAEFLSRDFSMERHRQAACKNAYALMGKHRHELAAAFFILGEPLLSHNLDSEPCCSTCFMHSSCCRR